MFIPQALTPNSPIPADEKRLSAHLGKVVVFIILNNHFIDNSKSFTSMSKHLAISTRVYKLGCMVLVHLRHCARIFAQLLGKPFVGSLFLCDHNFLSVYISVHSWIVLILIYKDTS